MITLLTAFWGKFAPNNKEGFTRHVAILVGGTAASQALLVLASPLLTRFYSPADFGILAVYSSILGVLTTISSLRYQLAIPLPESDDEAAKVLVLSCLVVLLFALATSAPVIFFRKTIAVALNTPTLASYLWLIPVGLFLSGLYQNFRYWALRKKAFHLIARTKFSQSFANIGIQIIGYPFGPISLLLGQIAGQAMGTIPLIRQSIQEARHAFTTCCFRAIAETAYRYRHFAIFSTWSGLFNSASHQIPPLLLAAFFSPKAAGLYLLANRVLAMPSTLVGQALAEVFFSKAPEAHRQGQLGALVSKVQSTLAFLAMPPLFFLFLTGPELFSLVFGSAWREAGLLVQWMVPWIYLVFVTSPISTVFSVLEKQMQGALWQGLLLGVRVIGILLAAPHKDIFLAVAFFSVGSAFCYLILLIWIYWNVGIKSPSIYIKPIVVPFLSCCLCFSPIILRNSFLPHNLFHLLVASSLSLLLLFLLYFRKTGLLSRTFFSGLFQGDQK